MNIRQQKYKKFRLEGYSKYTAARKAGYTNSTALQAARLEARIDMDYWLEREGLTDPALAQHASDGLLAQKIIGYLHSYKKNRNGKVERVKPDECVSNEFVESPDWAVRHKYLETILKLRKKLTDKAFIDNSKRIIIIQKTELNADTIRKQNPHKNRLTPEAV